jgi:uncharacterized repeat protein (TIGR01451 family)
LRLIYKLIALLLKDFVVDALSTFPDVCIKQNRLMNKIGLLALFMVIVVFSAQAQNCVDDHQPPVIILRGITLAGSLGDTLILTPEDVVKEAYDNCSQDLEYRIEIDSSSVPSNEDSPPSTDTLIIIPTETTTSSGNHIRVWARDEQGNWAKAGINFHFETCENVNSTSKCKSLIEVQIPHYDSSLVLEPLTFLNDSSLCYDNSLRIFEYDFSAVEILDTLFSPEAPDFLEIDTSDVGTKIVTIASTGLELHCNSYLVIKKADEPNIDCQIDTVPPLIKQRFTGYAISQDLVNISGEDIIDLIQDNCDSNEDIEFRIALGEHPADEIPTTTTVPLYGNGTKVISAWAIDQSGNYNYFLTYILVTNKAESRKTIAGQSFLDLDNSCSRDSSEDYAGNKLLRLSLFQDGQATHSNDLFLDESLFDGRYAFTLLYNYLGHFVGVEDFNGNLLADFIIEDTTNLQARIRWAEIPSSFCSENIIDLSSYSNDTIYRDIPLQLISNCAAPTVDIGTPFLRRCFPNTYFIDYCNYGELTADSTTIQITFDDYLEVDSISSPYSLIDSNTYEIYLGALAPGECGGIKTYATVSCDAVLGQTHCTEVSIHTATPCGNAYTGPEVSVEAECDEEEETVKLKLRNTGMQDMLAPETYIVVEDVIMLDGGDFNLPAGDSTILSFPANGSTYRLEATQVDGYPLLSMPSASIEGCGENADGNFSLGIIPQFPQDEAPASIAIDCQANIGAYDPNDKQASPRGVGPEHFLAKNQPLEYKIRFQNTGTDTAFTVIIRDTLSAHLVPSSVRPGASSHNYTYSLLQNDVLEFRFDNILLPDSTTNLEESQGFVQFFVQQQPDNPDGTLIENRAGIYFDFNEPIITNTVFHTIGEPITVINVTKAPQQQTFVYPYPNPVSHQVHFNLPRRGQGQLQVFNANGQLVHHQHFDGSSAEVHVSKWPVGMYWYRISMPESGIYSGKLMVKH